MPGPTIVRTPRASNVVRGASNNWPTAYCYWPTIANTTSASATYWTVTSTDSTAMAPESWTYPSTMVPSWMAYAEALAFASRQYHNMSPALMNRIQIQAMQQAAQAQQQEARLGQVREAQIMGQENRLFQALQRAEELNTPAHKRATELLLSYLDKSQKRSFKKDKIIVLAIAGDRRVRLTYGRTANIELLQGKEVVERLCVHPHNAYELPVEDVLLAQLLHLKDDPDRLFRIANRHPVLGRQPPARAPIRVTSIQPPLVEAA